LYLFPFCVILMSTPAHLICLHMVVLLLQAHCFVYKNSIISCLCKQKVHSAANFNCGFEYKTWWNDFSVCTSTFWTFEQYRDNTGNRDHFGHYNRDMKFSYRYISIYLRISLCLYIDDFEVCNPLGTSRKKHKLCAVYWILGSSSALSSIYLEFVVQKWLLRKYLSLFCMIVTSE